MAQLQSTCVIGTLSISASNAASQKSIMIGSGCNNAEFTNQCNIIAIGENTALSGSGALNPSSLTVTQEGGGFCPSYSYYARNCGAHKPFTLSGGGGGTGFDFKPYVPQGGYYGDPCRMPVFVDGMICNLGIGYTSTVTGTVYDNATTSETCEIFTIDPFTGEDVINIGHNAGCRAQGTNTIRIGSSAGRGNLTNGFCYQIDSIAIGKNTMASGSFENNVVIGHNSFTGNNSCTNSYRCQFFNTIIGNNNFPSSCLISNCNTVIGYCNLPTTTASLRNTVIGYCNAALIGTSKSICFDNVIIGNFNMCCSGLGATNVIIGCRNMACGCLNSANYNTAIGSLVLSCITTGDTNVAIGFYSGCCNTTGFSNVYIGPYAGQRNSTGNKSVFLGCGAGCGMGNQNDSIFIGATTGRYGCSNEGGHVVIGTDALRNNCAGLFNTAIGYQALYAGAQTSNSNGINGGCNIAIGYQAGACTVAASNNNIYIGQRSGRTSNGAETYKFYLGQGSGNHLMCGCLSSSGRTLCINGTLSKTAGSFAISHPNPIKTQACELWHSFVESPTAGDNLYRFKVEVENGQAIIDLPDYYKHLNENDQVWVNAKNHFGRAYGVVNQEQTTLTVFADTDGEYNILLIGTRKDKDAVNAWKGTERLKEN
jgi:hypothetical protein